METAVMTHNAVDVNLLLDSNSSAPFTNTYTATGVAQVDGSDGQIDLGEPVQSRKPFAYTLDVASIDEADADETYELNIEFSDDPAFASGAEASVTLPITAAGQLNTVVNGLRRYVRMRFVLGGTTPELVVNKAFVDTWRP